MKHRILSKAGSAFVAILLAVALCLSLIPLGFASAAETRDYTDDYASQFRSEASSAADALQRANELNQRIVEEGIVLMQNENDALPLKAGAKISVFGKNSTDIIFGGGGSASGADGSGQGGVRYYDLYDSLENAGFETNAALKAFYEDDSRSGGGRDGGSGTGQVATLTGETPVASYDSSLKSTFTEYDDAALIVLSRAGGEGADLTTNYGANRTGRSDYNETGDAADGDHYLELDDNEEDMIEMVTAAGFEKVIVVLNTGTSFEMTGIVGYEGIDSILWMGFPGGSGINALGKVLSGEVNPSGKTVDIYAKDFKADPTFANFATNYTSSYTGAQGVNFVEYDEGIYIGYRYYETRGFEEGGTWYDDNVVYPFGYGLSYTTFDWDVEFLTETLTEDGSVDVNVTVTNTGDVAGKDTVQLYYSAPYEDGGIEKSHVVLGAFEKTALLRPGQSQTLTLSMTVRTMASYDYLNQSYEVDGGGYVVEEGDYDIYVGSDSHVWADADAAKKTYTLDDTFAYTEDETSGSDIENRFNYMSAYFYSEEEAESYWTEDDILFAGHSSLMSRSDFEGTFPQPPTAAEVAMSGPEATALDEEHQNADPEFDAGQPWYTDEMPNQSEYLMTDIKATEMVGLDYDDPKWDAFMDQIPVDTLRDVIISGFFWTIEIPGIDLPMSITPDGPTGFVQGSGLNWVGNTCFYASPIVVASTWNKELSYAQGLAIGEEGIWGGEQGIRGGYNGWYAPGNNIHRSPFSGRNFEYYSEDPLLAGILCGEVTRGAQEKGVFVMMKHFALNDQETNRGDLATWADEQTMREIYLKAFEISVKNGNATGLMSAFNRFGHVWAGACYEVLTEVLRGEWGFHGLVVTDWVNGFMNASKMIRAGNDLWLAQGTASNLSTDESVCTPTHVAALRRGAKNVIYTVVNSNAMNRVADRYSDEFYDYSAQQYSKDLGTVAKGGEVSFEAGSKVFDSYYYELDGAPEGVTIDEMTGEISGTVAANAPAGKYTMHVSMYDEGGFIGQSATFTLTVSGGLTFTGSKAATVAAGEFFSVDVSAAYEGGSVTYALASGSTLPDGVALTADGRIVGTAAEGSIKASVVASAEDQQDLTTEVTITVGKAGSLTFAGSTLTAKAGKAFTANVGTATGADEVVYTATGLPAGLTMAADGTITGTPAEAGTYTVTVYAGAAGCDLAEAEFTLTVEQVSTSTPDPEPTPDTDPDPDTDPEPKPEEEGGCGSFVAGTSALVAAGMLAAAAVVLAAKKRTANK